MTFESIACDLCGADAAQPYRITIDHLYGFPGQFCFVRCPQCGLIYLNPRPDRASIGAYYPDLNYHAFRPQSGLKARVQALLRRREARALLAKVGTSARVLEVGCATGDLLVTLQSMGAEVTGIEPNAAAVEGARGRGLRVECGMLDDVSLDPSQFDLILMRYSLEHVHSPRATLVQAARLLKPGGQVVLWVPNADSVDAWLFGRLWRGLDAPRHLYIFTPATITRLAESAGMTVEHIGYSGVPNDWAGSFAFWLRARGLPHRLTRHFGAESPAGLLAWLWASAAAAWLHKDGRIRVVCRVR